MPMNAPAEPPRILVVEDDDKIAALLTDYLAASGFATTRFADGRALEDAVRANPPAAILLDLMLPGRDGIAICTALRQFSAVPIMMVTARVEEIDRLLGLELGADDYVCKPFSPREVVARLRALLRRAQWSAQDAAPVDGFAIDDAARRIRLSGHELPLTPLEFQLLRTLLLQPERVFSRDQLLDALHDDFRDVSDRAVDSHIKNLRRKIGDDPKNPRYIHTVYGVGYRLADAA
jgi:two-component system response regulator BaeR